MVCSTSNDDEMTDTILQAMSRLLGVPAKCRRNLSESVLSLQDFT